MLSLALLALSLLGHVYADPVVRVGGTRIIGKEVSGKTEFFGGIPFAKPPLGELRLNLPVPVANFSVKTIDARNFGPGCLQSPPPPSGVSEDCLTLDIYRPFESSPNSKLPAFVWIYGGGFTVGATSFYNGTSLVERSVSRGTPILVITINYRLGPLGFPQGIEAGQRKILNLGLHDQIAALQWIQKNIESFGGDKTKAGSIAFVTIGGESAGAASVTLLQIEPTIKGLARGGILESTGILAEYGPERNEAFWQEYVAAVPACASAVGTNNTFDCLRQADSVSLEQALITTQVTFSSNNNTFQPVIDGPGGILPDRFSQLVPKGSLPSLIGSNLDEGPLFTPQSINSATEIRNMLTAAVTPSIVSPQTVEDFFSEALSIYPDVPALGSPFGSGNNTFGLSSQYKRYAAMFGDQLFHSSRRTISLQMAEANVPVFAYLFTDPDAIIVDEFTPVPPVAPGSLGIPHTSEIPYVFGTLMNKTPNAVALSAVIQNYWISFINGLDPNDNHGETRPRWEQYTPTNRVVLQLDSRNTNLIPDNYREKQIALWQNNPDVLHR